MKKIIRGGVALAAIDLQERLMPAMWESGAVAERAARLVKGFRILGAPIVVTQQYTKGLGPTIAGVLGALTDELAEGLGRADFSPVEKTSFSAMGEPGFAGRLEALGKKAVAICGVEAHVCVSQTALDLLAAGYDVYVAADCVSSRREGDRSVALARLAAAGAAVTTCEAILFEMLGGAGEPGFKQISALVK
jgi:nicotinamidase-related amidase